MSGWKSSRDSPGNHGLGASSPPKFKPDAMALVCATGRPIAQIARELGIYDSTLGNWVRQDAIDRGEREGLTTQERERLQLEAENAKLRMERELLKRTVAFWVSEISTR
jgi:transposase